MASDLRRIGHAAGIGIRSARRRLRATAAAAGLAARWLLRLAGAARRRSGGGSIGMMRLLDLHAASCAGDVLVAIGLAGTIFFAAPTGEARGQVALYLVVTMVPFAVLAPIVGPLLDRFRHGRRYALSVTLLGRALLAWVIADTLVGFGLYPAAFGVLLLSRAYGVARGAAVPRLLPPRFGLSEAGARASVYGSVAGAIIAPIGTAAFLLGPQWPLRVASLVFLAGGVVALRLPSRADSDPPEVALRIVQVPWRQTEENGNRVLSGRLVRTVLAGSAGMRALYGFLLMYLAFAIREQGLDGRFLGVTLGPPAQLAVVGAALGFGTFAATAIGTNLRVRSPVRLQALATAVVAATAVWATLRFAIATVALLGLTTAIGSGLTKLAVDATIQERVSETVRSSAFAHAETVLMLAWVAGAAAGLVPIGNAQLELAAATVVIAAGAVRGAVLAARMRRDRLRGRTAEAVDPTATDPIATDPTATDPTATDPIATDPIATDPIATEPTARPAAGPIAPPAAPIIAPTPATERGNGPRPAA